MLEATAILQISGPMSSAVRPIFGAADMVTITISNWKPVRKGALRGFCTATMPSGMILHGISIFARNDGTLFASPPSRPMLTRDGTALRDADGKVKYQRITEFTDGKAFRLWSDAVIAALVAARPEAVDAPA